MAESPNSRPGSPIVDSSSSVSVGSNGNGGTNCTNRKRNKTPESETLNSASLNLNLGCVSEKDNTDPSPNSHKRRLVDDPNSDPYPNQSANPPQNSAEIFKCNFCQRGFATPQALGGHQNGHKHDRAFMQQCQRLMNPSDQFGYGPPMYDRYYPIGRHCPTMGPGFGGPMVGLPAVYGRPPMPWGNNYPRFRLGMPRTVFAPPDDGRRMRLMSVNFEQGGHVGTSSSASSGGGDEPHTGDLLGVDEEDEKELDLSLKL